MLGRLGRQSVDVDCKGGTITTDAGLLLLREVDRKLDLIRRIDKAIPDPRDQRYVTHKQRQMLTSQIFGIAAGYEDGNDHANLRNDAVFQVVAEVAVHCTQTADDRRPIDDVDFVDGTESIAKTES